MYKTVSWTDTGFSYRKELDYEDNIWLLTSMLPANSKVRVAKLTSTPDRLIECVKQLISVWGLRDVMFSKDYEYLIKTEEYEVAAAPVATFSVRIPKMYLR